MEMEDAAPRVATSAALAVSAVAIACMMLPPIFASPEVDRLRAELGLTQIKAAAIGLLHYDNRKYVFRYLNTIIAFREGLRLAPVDGHCLREGGAQPCVRSSEKTDEYYAHRWLMTAVNAPLERAAFSPQPGPGEVVVAVAGCGVCHTDLGYLYDGVRTNQP